MTGRGRIVVAVALAAMGAGGFGLARLMAPAPARALPPRARMVPAKSPGADRAEMQELVRAAVRAELDSQRADQASAAPLVVPALAPPGAAPSAEAAAPERSRQQLQAVATADRLLDSALAARRWNDADRDALRELLPELGADAPEVVRQLAVAVNQGQLTVETSGPPF